ncbi:RES domain-containing protein [Nocardioides sp.]|uniref:RES domain-containing protein n=1 Tax=Nocardioides sp. TaxID=35761 RepID=UPI00261F20D6|nr:RES domain-containing protein [Nocardioides sp.]
MTRRPPEPFIPEIDTLPAGTALYRVHSSRFAPHQFNPGLGAPSRFAFFPDQHGVPVPVLYAAAAENGAVAETLLHDVPLAGGYLDYDTYASTVMSRLTLTRPLRLAALHGLGLRRLHASADEVTSTPASRYGETVAWAHAAHAAGLDGVAWMSRQCIDVLAYVFFGDRCADALTHDTGFGRIFATGADLLWLIDLCAPLRVDVLPPSP